MDDRNSDSEIFTKQNRTQQNRTYMVEKNDSSKLGQFVSARLIHAEKYAFCSRMTDSAAIVATSANYIRQTGLVQTIPENLGFKRFVSTTSKFLCSPQNGASKRVSGWRPIASLSLKTKKLSSCKVLMLWFGLVWPFLFEPRFAKGRFLILFVL